MKQAVYKVLRKAEWKSFQSDKVFPGSEHDLRDGFIHLSTKDQVSGVLERYFSDSRPVFILKLSDQVLLDKLVWEEAKSGGEYPHLYNEPLRIEYVDEVEEII